MLAPGPDAALVGRAGDSKVSTRAGQSPRPPAAGRRQPAAPRGSAPILAKGTEQRRARRETSAASAAPRPTASSPAHAASPWHSQAEGYANPRVEQPSPRSPSLLWPMASRVARTTLPSLLTGCTLAAPSDTRRAMPSGPRAWVAPARSIGPTPAPPPGRRRAQNEGIPAPDEPRTGAASPTARWKPPCIVHAQQSGGRGVLRKRNAISHRPKRRLAGLPETREGTTRTRRRCGRRTPRRHAQSFANHVGAGSPQSAQCSTAMLTPCRASPSRGRHDHKRRSESAGRRSPGGRSNSAKERRDG